MPTPFVGRDKVYIGFGKETTRGTDAAATQWFAWQSLSFIPKNKKEYDNSAFGVLEENSDGQIVEEWSEGKLSGRVGDKSIGYQFYNLAGTHAASLHSGETAVWDHVFTESQSATPQSNTYALVNPNYDYHFTNGNVKQFELDVTQGKLVTYAADLIASKGASATDSPAVVKENYFTSKHVTVTLAPTVSGLTGGTVATIKSLKLTINKNTAANFNIGNNAPSDIYAGKVNITGSITLLYLDDTYRALDFNNTTNAMLIDIKNTDVTIGTASNPEVKIQLNALKFENWTPDNQLDKVNEQTLSFTGMLDTTTGAGFQITTTNTTASY